MLAARNLGFGHGPRVLLADSGIQRIFSLHVRDIDGIRRRLQIGDWDAMFASEMGYVAEV